MQKLSRTLGMDYISEEEGYLDVGATNYTVIEKGREYVREWEVGETYRANQREEQERWSECYCGDEDDEFEAEDDLEDEADVCLAGGAGLLRPVLIMTVVTGAAVTVAIVAPKVKKWAKEKVLPRIKRKRGKLTDKTDADPEENTEENAEENTEEGCGGE